MTITSKTFESLPVILPIVGIETVNSFPSCNSTAFPPATRINIYQSHLKLEAAHSIVVASPEVIKSSIENASINFHFNFSFDWIFHWHRQKNFQEQKFSVPLAALILFG